MSPETNKYINNIIKSKVILIKVGGNIYTSRLRDLISADIARLERQWKLI
ncbi:hypothetical protein BV133_219 [Blastochloris viridis]|uniref:Uridylate kinase n=1 Tax=Blastochloris viridis TaxID=1079 RepID=A0A182CZ99_BLAVI|nr:hypothetical protein BV133_219 [Blastochloris viridis]